MPPKKSKTPAASAAPPTHTRLWLMYPPKLITNPVIWELARKFPVVCLEIGGERPHVKAAIKWLEKIGIKVEPVEISVIES